MSSAKRNRYLKKKRKKAAKNYASYPSFPLDSDFLFPSMSEMLLDVAEPLLDEIQNLPEHEVLDAQHTIFSFAMFAWNISIDPSLKPSLPLQHFSPDKAQHIEEILSLLIYRKNTFFPFEQRLISDFDIQLNSDQKTLIVHSELPI